MKRAGFSFLSAGLIVLFAISRPSFAQTEPLPKFDEVYQLLLTNSSGLSELELNRAAVKGLLEQLQSQVVLVTNTSLDDSAGAELMSKVSVFDGSFAYFRIGKVESGLNDHLKSAYQKLTATNKLKGVVLDLRYASGTDYAAAAKTADLFIDARQPLLDWGESSAKSTEKTNSIAVPVAVLVNEKTSGAAEALAGILRETQTGLVIGTNTAGQASVFKEFTLENGQRLKIASAPVKLGNGKEIPDTGVKPDIAVAVPADEEKAFYEDPYRVVPRPALLSDNSTNNAGSAETNRPRRRLNEAELVRLQRQGISLEDEFAEQLSREPEPMKPILSDPALVRAIDLLKGLAVVQQSRRN